MVNSSRFNTLAIIQARTTSNRLPEKVLKKVNGKHILEWQILRVKQTRGIEQIVLATSEHETDDRVIEIAERCGIPSVRGSLENVYSRFKKVLDRYDLPTVIRITGDCPLFMPSICEVMLNEYKENPVDCLSNTLKPTYPDGCDIEIFSSSALRSLGEFSLTPDELEHVTLGIYMRRNLYKCRNYSNLENLSSHRWTLDTEEDWEFISKVYDYFAGREIDFEFKDVLEFLKENPKLGRYDDGTMRNNGQKYV
jgi:spore coat polysaccharide biosynthesis protein SpsF